MFFPGSYAPFFNIVDTVIGCLASFLPLSPLVSWIDSTMENAPFLAQINYFIPVGTLFTIASAWGAAILVYYGIKSVLKFANLV